MGASTEESWKIAHAPTAGSSGTLLNTYAYNIETLTGREGIPPRRGENLVIPYAKGRMWVPKIEDQRPVSLGMWVSDATVDGVRASTRQARRAQLRDNTQVIKDLFGVFDVLLNIERKIRRGSGLVTWTAQAECVGVLPFTWDDNFDSYVKVVVDLMMPDPYWYESTTPKL